MPDKPTQPDDEISKLRARVAELEAEIRKKGDKTPRHDGTSRVADSFSNASRSKIDTVTRMVRGLTIASFESARLMADSVSAFAEGVVSRSSATDSKSVRDLATRLPSDIVS